MRHVKSIILFVGALSACSAKDTVAPSEISLLVTPTTVELAPGDKTSISCMLKNSIEIVKAILSWSGGNSVAALTGKTTSDQAVDNFAGLVTALMPGTVTLTCSYAGPPSRTATAQVTVRPVTGTINPSSISTQVGVDKVAVASFKNFRSESVSGAIDWSTNPAGIASVSAQADGSAKVTGAAVGQTTLRATLQGSASGGAFAEIPVMVTAPPPSTCWPTPSSVTFKVRRISDPGGYDGTIGLGALTQIIATVTLSGGKIRVVGGGKITSYPTVDRVDATGSAPSSANGCAINLNEGTVTFGPGPHKTRLSGNALTTPGTKLTFQFLDSAGNVETEFELEVVSVQ